MAIWQGKEATVTLDNVISQVAKNVASILEQTVTDPLGANRPAGADAKFINIVFPKNNPKLPILVIEVFQNQAEMLGIGATNPTVHEVIVNIEVIGRTALETDTLSQAVAKTMIQQKQWFISYNMHPQARVVQAITPLQMAPENVGRGHLRTVSAVFMVYAS